VQSPKRSASLYNAALYERIVSYTETGKALSYFDQCKALTKLREDQEFAALPQKMQRWTLKRLDEAFAGFFRRLEERGKGGFPRYRNRPRWKSFGFSEFRGIRFDGKRLRFKGLPGGLRVQCIARSPRGRE
jgi:putative transposase